jgi:hypothetical protein
MVIVGILQAFDGEIAADVGADLLALDLGTSERGVAPAVKYDAIGGGNLEYMGSDPNGTYLTFFG